VENNGTFRKQLRMGEVALKWGFGSFGKWGNFTRFSKKGIYFKQKKKFT
jgi:hypothetical protein